MSLLAQDVSQQVSNLFQTSDAPISIPGLLVSLGIGTILAMVLRWHFRRFASTLSDREQFSQTFPYVLLTTLLIITIVKSSLALSLGLVGALSIVRFRTPIKEPEELAYLFLAIAIGLGLGAAQAAPTIAATIVILIVIAIMKLRREQRVERKNLFLSIHWSEDELGPEKRLAALNDVVSNYADRSDLRRFDVNNGTIDATYFVAIPDSDRLSELVKHLRENHAGMGITFIDQSHMPSV